MKRLILLFLFLYNYSLGFSQDGYPKPTVKDILFYIQHNRGKNTFIYQPNFTPNNQLHDEEPIKISRQLFDNNGEVKPLTRIQQHYVYGLKTKKLSKNHYEFVLVSYPDQKLFLKLDPHHKPIVEGTISGKYIRIHRLFIKLKDGTSGLQTQAEYILFYGIDRQGKAVQAKLIP